MPPQCFVNLSDINIPKPRSVVLELPNAYRRTDRAILINNVYRSYQISPVTGLEWPRGFQEVKVPISWQRHRKVVRLSALCIGRIYLQEIILVLISIRGRVDPSAIVRSEGLCQWKIPITPFGKEPATFRFVAQQLNHCATAVPMFTDVSSK